MINTDDETERKPLLNNSQNRYNKNEQTQIIANNEEINIRPQFVHLDGGYGWVVCFASFWCFGMIIGMDYNYSLIYNKLVDVYNNTENHVVYAGNHFSIDLLK